MNVDYQIIYSLYIYFTNKIAKLKKNKGRGSNYYAELNKYVKFKMALKYSLIEAGYINPKFARDDEKRIVQNHYPENAYKLTKSQLIAKRNKAKSDWKYYSELIRKKQQEMESLNL